jgi:hypothetical protein
MTLRFNLRAACLTAVSSLALSALALVASSSAVEAGGFGCDSDRMAECYQKVRTPDIYRTVSRPYVIAPARIDVVREPAVRVPHVRRTVIAPGRWTSEQLPAQYAVVERSVQVRPAEVSYVAVPAQYRSVRETVIVQPASYRWERQIDRRGNETMCKIVVPAVTRHVERQVQVTPAGRIRTVRQAVLVAPATVRRSYIAPSYADVQRTILVRPAREHVMVRPAVIGVTEQHVLVARGGTRWQRTY